MELLREVQLRLFQQLPGLRLALSGLYFMENECCGTDGATYYYNEETLIHLSNRGNLDSFFLHSIIHCLWLHIDPPRDIDRSLWNLSADIAAFYLSLQLLPGSYPPETGTAADELCTSFIEAAHSSHIPSLYHALEKEKDSDMITVLSHFFIQDDHSFWYEGGRKGLSLWKTLAKTISPHSSPSKKQPGISPGSREELIELRKKSVYDFHLYLRRFTTTGEELQLDPDSFDYIPYLYGLQSEERMPFIEPLEYSETNKIQELVIAIDTSGSCDSELVQQFLGETKQILTDRRNFFLHMNVHIIQCDSMIQSHVCIHSIGEWNKYIRDLRIYGRGGTDFTPVFTLVDSLIDSGEFHNLKGLLYFTDGDGVYPRTAPNYETAFIFPDYRFLEYRVPEWIRCLCLEIN